jgi:signal transduction histidine kinase
MPPRSGVFSVATSVSDPPPPMVGGAAAVPPDGGPTADREPRSGNEHARADRGVRRKRRRTGPAATSSRWRGPILLLGAVAAAVATVLLKAALAAWWGLNVGFVPAVAAVVVIAWLGGPVYALVTTGLYAMLDALLLGAALGGLFGDLSALLRLVLFLLFGVLASSIAWQRQRVVARADGQREAASRAWERADLAARRLDALQLLTTDLATAATTERIAAVVVARAAAALLADRAALFLTDPQHQRLRLRAWQGYEPDRAEGLRDLPLDIPLPACDVARTGQPVFIEDPAVYASRYGPAHDQFGLSTPAMSVAAVPLTVEGRRCGALGFTWEGPHELAPDRRAFIEALARLAAGALERVRLFDRERDALRLAQAAQGRLDLLAEAGRILGMTLDYETTVRHLASLPLPLLGEVGVVDIAEGSSTRRLAASPDPALAEAVAAIQRHPARLPSDSPVARVLREGRPEIVELDAFDVDGLDPELARALAMIGAHWALVSPLRVQDRTIGTLTVLRQADQRYGPDEMSVVEELGSRAGRALENARLHQEVARLADRELRHAAELEGMIAAIGDGILVADPDGVVRSSNAAANRLLGGSVGTIREVLARLVRPDGRSPRTLAPGPTEYRLASRPNGWLELVSYPIPGGTEGTTPSTVVVARDVTVFRQGQALREAFLGLLSHELRTPVTTIYGGAAVLSKPSSLLDTATRAEILADIAAEADRLYRLVEDLMVLARFDEGLELGAEPVLLQHLLPAVIEQERGRWPGTTFRSDIAPNLPAVSGDETSITQVVRNLLSNAAKYGREMPVVTTIIRRDPDGVKVEVCDEGPGIDPAEAERIFDPFYRSPSTARLVGGVGIGLYVSRRLVDAMGGRISAARRPEGGSSFAFVIPEYRGDADT